MRGAVSYCKKINRKTAPLTGGPSGPVGPTSPLAPEAPSEPWGP